MIKNFQHRYPAGKFTNRFALHEAGHAIVSCIQNTRFEVVKIDDTEAPDRRVKCLRDPGMVISYERGTVSIETALKDMRTAQAGREVERLFCGRYLCDSIGREISLGKHNGFENNGTDGDFIGKILAYVCGPYVKEQTHVEQWGVLTVRRWLTSNAGWVVAVATALLENRSLTEAQVRKLDPRTR